MLREIFTLSSTHTSRLAWIDYAKGIAISMVVFRHLTIGMERAGVYIDPALFAFIDEVGVSFRMPLFFLLSGIFFRKSIEKRSHGGYLLHKSKTILYPYLLWSFIITSLQILLSGYSNTQADMINYLHIFVQPWGHWWFLYALFNVSALYMLMHLLSRGYRLPLLAAGAGLYFASPLLEGYTVLQDICALFIFFAIGDLLANTLAGKQASPQLGSGKLLLLLALAAGLGEWILFEKFLGTPASLLLLVALAGSGCTMLFSHWLAGLHHPRLDVIRTIGQHSLYIYLLHAPVGAAIRALFLYGAGITNYWIIIPLAFPAALLLPLYFYRLCMRLGLRVLFNPPFSGAKETTLSPANS
ncbi:acyltransferase family protein [Cesiribacter andamanensis]|uniref:Glucans biosynthesis protein n=1 Tax=Cesiribacter andamanensis AMV16 TaxID=1279009 RepID=M7NSJ3_9BACT|nr:acyltransferase [Cesiribacter andamanensis]EMR04660.1 glucans biosynthesis protein [Cesiribacter andamanensis AMV16]